MGIRGEYMMLFSGRVSIYHSLLQCGREFCLETNKQTPNQQQTNKTKPKIIWLSFKGETI